MDDMAHEKEKAQYEEDRLYHGSDAYKMWEFTNPGMVGYAPCRHEPMWRDSMKYRRKEPPFQPEYFSGLNWREAEHLIERAVNASKTGDEWSSPLILTSLNHDCMSSMKFMVGKFGACRYIRTCPETHAHPTITIGDKELPRPEVDAPGEDTKYWLFCQSDVFKMTWCGNGFERCWLKKGMIHLTEDRAQAWASWWDETVVREISRD